LRDFVVEELKKVVASGKVGIDGKIPKIIFNGTYGKDEYGNSLRVPNNINICIPGMDAEYAVLRLDVRGVCVSSVTSCRSKNEDSTSYVVEALNNGNNNVDDGNGVDTGQNCGRSSLRITLGRFTTEREVKKLVKVLLEMLRK
jgi:cysteine sulfinate desulfinase/cysteine desulfurase-like protein